MGIIIAIVFSNVIHFNHLFSAFNRQWNIKLQQKREAELEADRILKAKAAEDMANWHAQREVRLNAKKEKNRSEEQVLLETIESDADGANVWERVTKLIDQTAEVEAGKADVVRMRKLFIQLKNEPLDKTRGAARAEN